MTNPILLLILTIIVFICFGILLMAGFCFLAAHVSWFDKHFNKFIIFIIILTVLCSGIFGYLTLSEKPNINTYNVTKVVNSKHADEFTITYINKKNQIKSINVDSNEIKIVNTGKNKIIITDYKYSVGGYVKAYINKKNLETLMK